MGKKVMRAITAVSTYGASELGRTVARNTGSAELGLLTSAGSNWQATSANMLGEGLAAPVAPEGGITQGMIEEAAKKGTGGAPLPGLVGDGTGKTPATEAAAEELRRRTRVLLTGGQGDTSKAPTYAPVLGGDIGALLGGATAQLGRVRPRPTRY